MDFVLELAHSLPLGLSQQIIRLLFSCQEMAKCIAILVFLNY